MIRVVIGVAERCGLNKYKGKSNVPLHSHMGMPAERVGGIVVANSVRYLETNLGNSRKCYNTYKNGMIVLTENMANLAFSVVYKSCNRVLIGKTY